MDAEPEHDRETRPVDDRKGLVREGVADRPGRLKIGGNHELGSHDACANPTPEGIGSGLPEPSLEEQPRLDEDVVCRHQSFIHAEDYSGAIMPGVSEVNGGVEDRRIDEQGQRRGWAASTASPTYSCLKFATSEPPESPRPKMLEMSALGIGVS